MNKIFFVSLGCDKNRVDSEEMLGILRDAGFSFTYDETEADIIIVNTCCFIDSAKEESIETILEMASYKKTGNCKRLVVCGCMAERYKDEVLKELPEVDFLVGVNNLEDIIKAISEDSGLAENFSQNDKNNISENKTIKPKRILTTGGHYEYLKIAEGCSKHCTYCIIPSIRGEYRSRPMEDLLEEAEYLASEGVKELIIVAQETTVYGKDIYGRKTLPEFLHKLCRIEGIEWIRLLYAYPEEITEELLNVIASEDKICKYLDMPIQHASDKILKRMGRRTNKEELKNIIKKARDIMPDIALRTSLISGFPGETEDDHKELLDFVGEMRFDRLGVFTYSQEEGTPAASFEGQIEEDTKEARRDEIMQLQEVISEEKNNDRVGKVFYVFIEGKLADENVYVGRTYMDAPDVDSLFFVECDYELISGSIVKAKTVSADIYDLYGEIVDL